MNFGACVLCIDKFVVDGGLFIGILKRLHGDEVGIPMRDGMLGFQVLDDLAVFGQFRGANNLQPLR